MTLFRTTSIKTHFVFAFVVALLAQAADVATTIYGIKHGASETNSLMASVISNFGFVGFALVKLSAAFVMTALSFFNRAVAVLFAVPFFMFAWHNLQVIRGL